jgi:hypothetical protein
MSKHVPLQEQVAIVTGASSGIGRATAAALNGKTYTHILDEPYRWSAWAAPKGKDGKIDHNAALTCDDLIAFVNGKLFFYLRRFKAMAIAPHRLSHYNWNVESCESKGGFEP